RLERPRDRHELRAHVVEPHLVERGRPETVAQSAAQGKTRHQLDPRRDLPRHCTAEVAVALVAAPQVECHTVAQLALEPDVPADARARDRKSTRLNSSHQIISYAVFFLKKKQSC